MLRVKLVFKYIFFALILLLFLFPVIFMLASSFMSAGEVSKMLDLSNGNYADIKLIPNMFSLEQYYQVFFRRPEYLLKFWNSVIITFPTVIMQVIVASLAAFAFAKLKFPFRDKLFFIYIVLLVLPLQVTLVPNYIVLNQMNLLNHFLAVILPGTFSAFGICLLRQSIKYVSNSSIDAARIDGASYFKIFIKIILPQIKGGLATLILLIFIDNWNMVEQPLIYFDDKNMYPLSIQLSNFSRSDYGVVFACGVMFMVPALLVYLFGAKEIDTPFISSDKI